MALETEIAREREFLIEAGWKPEPYWNSHLEKTVDIWRSPISGILYDMSEAIRVIKIKGKANAINA